MRNENTWNISFKTAKSSLILFSIFLAFGLWTGLTRDIRYLYVFLYLGGGIATGGFLGEALPRKHRAWGRRITQIFVASFLLGFMGFTYKENMQIEGFFFYLLMGVFAGAAHAPGRVVAVATTPPNSTTGGEAFNFSSFHPTGTNFLNADGSVRLVSQTIEKAVFFALCTRANGDLTKGFLGQ